MTNTYRAVSDHGKSTYGEDTVELDLSVMDEKDAIDGGHLEIVPRPYKVLSDNFSGGPQDATYTGALRKETEAALIAGGHIERVVADGGASTFKDASATGGKAATKKAAEEKKDE